MVLGPHRGCWGQRGTTCYVRLRGPLRPHGAGHAGDHNGGSGVPDVRHVLAVCSKTLKRRHRHANNEPARVDEPLMLHKLSRCTGQRRDMAV